MNPFLVPPKSDGSNVTVGAFARQHGVSVDLLLELNPHLVEERAVETTILSPETPLRLPHRLHSRGQPRGEKFHIASFIQRCKNVTALDEASIEQPQREDGTPDGHAVVGATLRCFRTLDDVENLPDDSSDNSDDDDHAEEDAGAITVPSEGHPRSVEFQDAQLRAVISEATGGGRRVELQRDQN